MYYWLPRRSAVRTFADISRLGRASPQVNVKGPVLRKHILLVELAVRVQSKRKMLGLRHPCYKVGRGLFVRRSYGVRHPEAGSLAVVPTCKNGCAQGERFDLGRAISGPSGERSRSKQDPAEPQKANRVCLGVPQQAQVTRQTTVVLSLLKNFALTIKR